MNQNQADAMIDDALRKLDPSADITVDAVEQKRADALFARIVASPEHDLTRSKPGHATRRTKWLLAPAGLLAVGAGGAVLLTGGGSAFATWTPTPEPLTEADAAAAASVCLGAVRSPTPVDEAAIRKAHSGMDVKVAEQRGDWVYVMLQSSERDRFCVIHEEDLNGDETLAEHRRNGFLGGGGAYDPDNEPRPDENGIAVTVVQEGPVPTDRPWPLRDSEEWLSVVNGRVGGNVTGLTVHTPTGIAVDASIADGHFAAWWPSNLTNDAAVHSGAVTYTVTLADGQTRSIKD